MIEVSYRDATIHDLPAIVEIYNSTIPSRMVTADTERVTVESRIAWFNEHSSSKRPLWIVEDPGKNCIGWVSFQSFYGRAAYDATAEISIYLDEKVRGKSIGTMVLQYALQQCPLYGIKNLLGYIFSHNEPSLRLFRQLGFEDWGTLPGIALLDGVERTLKIVGRKV